jgi:hypothetical protein
MRHRGQVSWLAAAALVAVGCGGSVSSGTPVPPEFRSACGHPGAHVAVRHVPVTIRHADCDLTGVSLSYKNYGGATVPAASGGIGSSGGLTVTVHPGSRDVSVNAGGDPGNA